MTHDPSNPFSHEQPTGPQGPELSLGAMLRCAADDELTADQQAALRAYLGEHAEDEARIRFERQLRAACARAVCGEGRQAAAPDELRARVRAAINGSSTDAPAGAEPGPRRSWARRHAWSIAAALVLTATLGLITRQVLVAIHDATPTTASLVRFLNSEHTRCGSSQRALRGKMKVTKLEQVPESFRPVLGNVPSLEAMSRAGFVFAGAGNCAVPGRGHSVHLMFRYTGGGTGSGGTGGADASKPVPGRTCPGDEVSLFIQQDTHQLALEEGQVYAPAPQPGIPGVVVWTHDGLIYYLVTETPDIGERARGALGVGAPSQPL